MGRERTNESHGMTSLSLSTFALTIVDVYEQIDHHELSPHRTRPGRDRITQRSISWPQSICDVQTSSGGWRGPDDHLPSRQHSPEDGVRIGKRRYEVDCESIKSVRSRDREYSVLCAFVEVASDKFCDPLVVSVPRHSIWDRRHGIRVCG